MRVLIAFLFFAFVAASCGSSTYVTNSWKKPDATARNFKHIAVMVLNGNEPVGRGTRQQMETDMAAALQKQGYNAFSTYAQYGPQRLERTSEDAAIKQLQSSNADAILTVVLLDKSKEKSYVPASVSYAPVGGYYNRFWGYYTTVYDRMYSPGYYTTNTRYFWEANLYDLTQNGDALVYTAQSESFDPSSAESLGRAYARTIVADMDKAGIIRKERK